VKECEGRYLKHPDMLIDRREWLLARALHRRRSGKIFLEQNSWYDISKIFSVLFTRNALARYFIPLSPVGGIGEIATGAF